MCSQSEASGWGSGSAEVFKVLPATRHMNLGEVGKVFGGLPKLRQVLDELPRLIYV